MACGKCPSCEQLHTKLVINTHVAVRGHVGKSLRGQFNRQGRAFKKVFAFALTVPITGALLMEFFHSVFPDESGMLSSRHNNQASRFNCMGHQLVFHQKQLIT